MIKLFSEKVNPTFTSSDHNILLVESFEEVFFDVFEFEINGTTYIAEKEATYKGSPVVSIPVVEGGDDKTIPFVLTEGDSFEVLYNSKNTSFKNDIPVIVEEQLRFESDERDAVDTINVKNSYKQDIFEEVEATKRLAEEYADRVKLQKIEEANISIEEKKRDITDFFDNARGDLLQEFNKALIDNRSDIEAYGEQKHSELEKYLTARIESNFDVFFESNNDRIKDLTASLSDKVDQIADKLVEDKIDPALYDVIGKNKDALCSITEDINNTLSETEQRVVERVESELEKGRDYIGSVEQAITEQNVELNDLIKKGVDKALGRVGNIKTSVLHLEEQLNSKVGTIEENLKDLCEESIRSLGKEVGDRVEIDISKAKEDVYKRSKLLDDSVKSTVSETLGKIDKVDESVEKLASKVSSDTKQISKQVDAIKVRGQQSSVKLNKEVERLEESLDKKILDKTKDINSDVAANVSRLEERVHADLEENKRHMDSVETVITQQGVELNNTVNEGIHSALDKVQAVESSVTLLKEEINKSVSVLEEKVLSDLDVVDKGIRGYYDDKINSVENEVKSLTEKQKKHFISLIEESRESLLDQINEDKDKFKAVVINEAQSEVSRILALAAEEESEELSHVGDVNKVAGTEHEHDPARGVIDFEKSQKQLEQKHESFKSELEKVIGDKFTNEISALKRLIELSSGGGSVAMQFAEGGTMKGNLTVVGAISAKEYLGLGNLCNEVVLMKEISSCPSTDTISVSANLNLNGYSITNVGNDSISFGSGAIISSSPAGDIILTPQPGQALTMNGIVSAVGFTDGGNGSSDDWDSAYTTVQTESAGWDERANLTDVIAASGNWDSTYTTVQTESAGWDERANLTDVIAASGNWDSTYTTVGANSASWDERANLTDVIAASGNWDSTYTTVQTESAGWDSTYTTVQGNSAFWDGNFCDEVVYMSKLSSCDAGGISVSAELAMNDNPISQLHYIDWHLDDTIPAAEGRLAWNDTDGTLDLGLKGGNVNLQIGMEQVVRVRNNDVVGGVANGQVVYINGAHGQAAPTVAIASNDTQLDSHSVIGVATESIAQNSFGYVTTQGLVRDINTNNIPVGEIAYLGTTGNLVSAVPITPDHEVIVGYCINQDATNGILFTSITLGQDLGDQHDVLITNPQANDTLLYNSISSIWENQTSSNWESTYTTVSANSAAWDAHTDPYDDSLLQSTSATWDSTYTTVSANSAVWGSAASSLPDTIVANLSTYDAITTETTSTINVASTDGIILVDASAGAAVINLPSAVGNNGRRITIKKIDITNNTATLSADTNIDGLDTFTINKKYDAVEVMSDNTQWWII